MSGMSGSADDPGDGTRPDHAEIELVLSIDEAAAVAAHLRGERLSVAESLTVESVALRLRRHTGQ